jgi:hypothetical protein
MHLVQQLLGPDSESSRWSHLLRAGQNPDLRHESFSNNLTWDLGEVNGGDDLAYKLSGITSLIQSLHVFDARVELEIGGKMTIEIDTSAGRHTYAQLCLT